MRGGRTLLEMIAVNTRLRGSYARPCQYGTLDLHAPRKRGNAHWLTWPYLEDYYYRDLAPLPVEDVRELLRWTMEDLAEVAAILRTRGDGRALELCYEDMFLGERSHPMAASRGPVVPSRFAAM